MIKMVLILFFVFTAGFAFAGVDLQAEHGEDLNKAPFVMRYKFEQSTGVNWYTSTYGQRKGFLEQWYKAQADNAKKEAQAAKLKQKQDREEARRKRNEERKQQQYLEDQARQERQKKKEEEEEKEHFADIVRENKEHVDDMRRDQREDR